MPSDTEPRYRLVDSNGNVVGSLYAEADGTLKLQEGTSGSDNEVSIATDGTFSAPAVSTSEAVIGSMRNFGEELTIADDDVGTIDSAFGFTFIQGTPGTDPNAILFVEFNTLNDIYLRNSTNQGGGSAPTGTTGPDGTTNFFVKDGTLYIENRTGSQVAVGYQRMRAGIGL